MTRSGCRASSPPPPPPWLPLLPPLLTEQGQQQQKIGLDALHLMLLLRGQSYKCRSGSIPSPIAWAHTRSRPSPPLSIPTLGPHPPPHAMKCSTTLIPPILATWPAPLHPLSLLHRPPTPPTERPHVCPSHQVPPLPTADGPRRLSSLVTIM